jgi:hypothetical protein
MRGPTNIVRMTISEFLAAINFKPYASVVNSWDSFNAAGSALMQLWAEPGQRVRDHAVAGAYLRVCCWSAEHLALYGKNQSVGYNGRAKAIKAIESGATGYAALSDTPLEKRGPGAWAKNSDLTKVYPVLQIERPPNTQDVFAILGAPIPLKEIR